MTNEQEARVRFLTLLQQLELTDDFYYRKSDSSNELKTPLNNPSSGLPMINSGIDIGGNAYGSHHKK
ncbi:hypothetical protein [Providencia sp. NPDC089923]|uniref:hypothetical protein n=1 Tax=Providencia sp. NPDC089923 TaxID=3415004 RepID=UPI003C2BB7E5